MSHDFEDVYLPPTLARINFTSSPRTSTTITSVASGNEQANKNWKHPLRRFVAPGAIDCDEKMEDIKDHWLVMGGPFIAFPIRDPMDFASVRLLKANLAPAVSPTDQQFFVGDGLTRVAQLKKTYTRGTRTYVRNIALPIVDSVVVALNGLPPSTPDPALPGGPYTWDVDRLTGNVDFDPPLVVGVVATAGYLFDVACRFESDDVFDQIVSSYQVREQADLSFVEKRFPCRNGDSG